MLDLGYLRTFLAIYRAQSVSKAATKLHLAQPTVSQHLQALEASIGQPLFSRHSRGVTPTAAAHDLAARIAESLDALEAMADALTPSVQVVHVGGPSELLATRIAPALAEHVGPERRVVAKSGLVTGLLDSLAAGALDIVVASEIQSRPGIRFEKLFEDHLQLVGSPRQVQLDADVGHTEAALAHGPFVAFDIEMPLIRRYFAQLLDIRVDAEPLMVLSDQCAIALAVAAGAGISVLPRFVVRDMVSEGKLVILHEPDTPMRQTYYLGMRRGSRGTPAAEWARHLLRSCAATW